MEFHPYREIGERQDIDLVCHSGDYIYEFVDDKGWFRARNDRFDLDYVDFRKWFNRDECARRYALYRSDPDLIRAHQCAPFTIMPDQHDFDDEVDPDTGLEFTEADASLAERIKSSVLGYSKSSQYVAARYNRGLACRSHLIW